MFSSTFAPPPRTLIGISTLLLMLAAVFGALNIVKIKMLRSSVAAERHSAQRRASQEKELKARETAVAAQEARLSQSEGTTANADAQLAKIENEKADLQAKLQANESEIAALRKQLEEKQPSLANPGAPSTVELQAQLDDARQQLDRAEREKVLLAEKLQRSSQLEEEKKRRGAISGKVGVRGMVLAVNQAYNFVVLNLGGRQGVEQHSEMLVLRDGSFIGKIRISSVEPATAIGDIITSSLAQGVQVQPGDIVIYAGTNS